MDFFELLAWITGPIFGSLFIYYGAMGLLKGKTVGLFRWFYRTLPSNRINNKLAARVLGVIYLVIGGYGMIYMLQLILEFISTGNLPHILDY